MPSRPLLLGHRGARATRSIPELTIASFDLALKHGCDGFEFDVRRTKDGAAVLCHDPLVRDITIAEATREALPDLPLLEEVLARYAERAFLDIELKVPTLEAEVMALVERHAPQRGFVISSFLPETLLEFRARNPSMPLGLIADRSAELARWRELPVEYVMPHHRLTTRKLIEDVHAVGRKLFVWTVNNENSMRQFATWEADGIISDDTQLLVQTVRELDYEHEL
jgi:glycerophosphoryl diester phosphodiesterase